MREFLENLVRMENAIAARCDQLGAQLDRLAETGEAESTRLRDRDLLLHAALEERVRRLEERVLG